MNIFCINLKSRGDRKTLMKKQARKAGFKIEFLRVDKNVSNPERGCLESHHTIISKASGDKILILEDDAVFSRRLDTLPEVPEDWDIIYLGGTVKESTPYNEHFNRATHVLSTHAYILRNTLYEKLKNELLESHLPIDVYYALYIQPNYKCYILKDHMTSQRSGYSDIQNTNIDYSVLQQTPDHYTLVDHTIDENNQFILKTDDAPLPSVSIITPTRDRAHFLPLMLHNIISSEYPKHLIEWVIVDDSELSIQDFLPKDPGFKIKYIHLQTPDNNKEPLTISFKRNYAIKMSTNDIIVHMDDDDIYDRYSILARVRSLNHNKAQLVGSNIIECIDLHNNNSFRSGSETGTILEATMAYRKSFWAKQPFNERIVRGEGLLFLHKRNTHDIRILPGMFVIVALTHTQNITSTQRNTESIINTIIYDNLDKGIKNLLAKIKDTIYNTSTPSSSPATSTIVGK